MAGITDTPGKVVSIREIIIPAYYSTFNASRTYTHKIFDSGRAGTKSSRAGIKAIYKIISDPHCSVVALRKHHNKLKKTIYKEVLRAIGRLGLSKKDFKITVSPMEITYKKYGTTIYFTGSDGIDDTKGIIDEENPIKLVIIDELTEFFDDGDGEDELMNIEATFVRGNSDEFTMEYYFNPPKNQKAPIMQWVDKMCRRPDTIRIHTTFKDVPVKWLGKKLIDSAEELRRNDEKMYRWVWLGECVGIDDVIYYMFDPERHVSDRFNWADIAYIGIGVDYGQKNATTYQAFGLDMKNRKLRGVGEYWHSGRDTGKQKSPSEYAQDFKAFKERLESPQPATHDAADELQHNPEANVPTTRKKVTDVFIDPSAQGLAEEIRRLCPDVMIHNAKNDVAVGIQRVSKLLSLQAMTYHPTQKNLQEEMYLYQYDEKSIEAGKEVPVKVDDHACDAQRYLVMGYWRRMAAILPGLALGDKKEASEE